MTENLSNPDARERLARWWSDVLWEMAARRMARGKRLGWIGWAACAFDKPDLGQRRTRRG